MEVVSIYIRHGLTNFIPRELTLNRLRTTTVFPWPLRSQLIPTLWCTHGSNTARYARGAALPEWIWGIPNGVYPYGTATLDLVSGPSLFAGCANSATGIGNAVVIGCVLVPVLRPYG